ncbi:hypothetical protein CAEBREN_11271 [Caenorhabditis brenneri]|uniref:BHLH domain-containing protein n=1 Tax=Caenorhabditis brenneri TaxID=135651 RepID=G0P2I5_CAEBE|nr:hypothetical protein CAEBREN_11271 [Caenorhabditis brenneri]
MDELRKKVPINLSSRKKLTTLETLRAAISYINYLRSMLQTNEQQSPLQDANTLEDGNSSETAEMLDETLQDQPNHLNPQLQLDPFSDLSSSSQHTLQADQVVPHPQQHSVSSLPAPTSSSPPTQYSYHSDLSDAALNDAMNRLREKVPTKPWQQKKLTTIKTLRAAINYINYLRNVLQTNEQQQPLQDANTLEDGISSETAEMLHETLQDQPHLFNPQLQLDSSSDLSFSSQRTLQSDQAVSYPQQQLVSCLPAPTSSSPPTQYYNHSDPSDGALSEDTYDRSSAKRKIKSVKRNDRERARMVTLNGAMDELRKKVPKKPWQRYKLSRIETLRSAIDYINDLRKTLHENEQQPPLQDANTLEDGISSETTEMLHETLQDQPNHLNPQLQFDMISNLSPSSQHTLRSDQTVFHPQQQSVSSLPAPTSSSPPSQYHYPSDRWKAALNGAFNELRKKVPTKRWQRKKLTELETLGSAIDYINNLRNMLQTNEQQPPLQYASILANGIPSETTEMLNETLQVQPHLLNPQLQLDPSSHLSSTSQRTLQPNQTVSYPQQQSAPSLPAPTSSSPPPQNYHQPNISDTASFQAFTDSIHYDDMDYSNLSYYSQ